MRFSWRPAVAVAAVIALIGAGFEAIHETHSSAPQSRPAATPERHHNVQRVLTATDVDVLARGQNVAGDCAATSDAVLAAGRQLATTPMQHRAMRALAEQRHAGGRILCASDVDVLP